MELWGSGSFEETSSANDWISPGSPYHWAKGIAHIEHKSDSSRARKRQPDRVGPSFCFAPPFLKRDDLRDLVPIGIFVLESGGLQKKFLCFSGAFVKEVPLSLRDGAATRCIEYRACGVLGRSALKNQRCWEESTRKAA